MNIGKYTSQLSEYMEYKKYAVNSIENYISSLKIFLEYFNVKATKPSEISKNDIISFLKEIKSVNTHKAYLCAIKLFYTKIINQPEKCAKIEQPRSNKKLPIVLTQEEVQRMFNVCNNLKHKVILSLLYGCGLRVSELINIQWSNIDRSAMILNVISGKGKKDRQVDLPDNIIPLLEKYYREYRCKPFILSGQLKNKYTQGSILKVVKKYADLAGISKRTYTHLMRHCSFTHMAENGVDLGYIQRSAGHESPITTTRYIHMSHNLVKMAKSPLNNIKL